ncbi:MAG: CPBP family intramembrane metalloprotease [Rhizobium sp.]|nr:CPBP family intramembrane metalloprotease [Rhizobium sp.]
MADFVDPKHASNKAQKSDTRPALWLRVLQFPLTRLILLGPLLFLLMGISNGFWSVQFADRPVLAIASAALMGALAIAVYVAFVRFIEQRPVGELALSSMGRELGLGLIAGAGLCTLCVVILMLLGVYHIEGINPPSLMLASVAMALSSGVFEELLHRGTIFRNVEALAGSWIALLVSAVIFGLVHLTNPDGNIVGALAITIEAGLLLAALYLVTRRLWLSFGAHIAWNFTQSGIFSGSVSGAFEQPGLFKAVIEGPQLLTGGAFGMEASIIALIVCTTTGVLVLHLAFRRGNFVPPIWRGR